MLAEAFRVNNGKLKMLVVALDFSCMQIARDDSRFLHYSSLDTSFIAGVPKLRKGIVLAVPKMLSLLT